jgi:hypothetical protein
MRKLWKKILKILKVFKRQGLMRCSGNLFIGPLLLRVCGIIANGILLVVCRIINTLKPKVGLDILELELFLLSLLHGQFI